MKASGCEANAPALPCPVGYVIGSGTLKYGRWDNEICPHPTVNSKTPAEYDTFAIPRRCKGMNSCKIGPMDPQSGKAYVNVYKHYELTYTCISLK